MRILEEFWYGNIEPTEYDTTACKEYDEILRLITRNEEKLLATMTDEQKELFSRYTDCVGYSCAGVPLFRRNGYRQSSGRKPLFRNRDTALN